MADEFQVQTHGVAVEVVLLNSTVIKGQVFLHDAAPDHEGEETVEDLLNGADLFFPVGPGLGDSGTVLVNKNQTLFLKVPLAAGRSNPGQGHGGSSWAVKVSMELVQGAPLQGVLYFEQPPGRDRTLDGLNEAGAFLCLAQDTGFAYVRRDAIVTVKELGPQFESIRPPAP